MEGTLTGVPTIKAGDTYNYINNNSNYGIELNAINQTFSFKMFVKGSIRLNFRTLSCQEVEISLRKPNSVRTFLHLTGSISNIDRVLDVSDIEAEDYIDVRIKSSSSSYGLRVFRMTYDI